MAEYTPFRELKWYPEVSRIFTGIPEALWGSIVQVESSGNPYAVGDQGRSFGLFQLFTGGGLGDGRSSQELFDPATNAEIAARSIKPVFAEAQSKGLTGFALVEYVASHAGWPLQTGNMPDSYRQRLQEAYTAYSQPKTSQPPPKSGGGVDLGTPSVGGSGGAALGGSSLLSVLRQLDRLEQSKVSLLQPGEMARKYVLLGGLILLGLILTGVGLVAFVGTGSVVSVAASAVGAEQK